MEDNKILTPLEIATVAVKALDSKKGKDIRLFYVEKETTLADYVLVCTGTSKTQLNTLAEEVEFKLEEKGVQILHTEGRDSGTWVLKDYGSVVVHVFLPQTRDFYKIEKMYGEESEVPLDDMLKED